MATIRKRQFINSFLWEVQIRRAFCPYLQLSFESENEAIEWVNEHEKRYILNPDLYLKFKNENQDWKNKIKREFNNDKRRNLTKT